MKDGVFPGDNGDLFPDELPESSFVFDNSPRAKIQRIALMEALHGGAVNTFNARDLLSISHPAARVQELRELGNFIHTDRVRAQDSSGKWHSGVASYVLIRETIKEEA